MNAVQLGFPSAVNAMNTKPKAYTSPYAMVQSIEQKLRGGASSSAESISYHESKRREEMNQLLNKFRDKEQMDQWKAKNGTSVRTIAYDGPRMNMPFNMVCASSPVHSTFTGSGLRYDNQQLGRDLLARRAKQLSEQQVETETGLTPSMASMAGLEDMRASPYSKGYAVGPEVEPTLPVKTEEEQIYERIAEQYDLLIDGLDSGLVGQLSFQYLEKIAREIARSGYKLGSARTENLIELNEESLDLARAIESKKVPSNLYLSEIKAGPLSNGLLRITSLLKNILETSGLDKKSRRLAFDSTVRNLGMQKLATLSSKKQSREEKREIARMEAEAKKRAEVPLSRPEEIPFDVTSGEVRPEAMARTARPLGPSTRPQITLSIPEEV